MGLTNSNFEFFLGEINKLYLIYYALPTKIDF